MQIGWFTKTPYHSIRSKLYLHNGEVYGGGYKLKLPDRYLDKIKEGNWLWVVLTDQTPKQVAEEGLRPNMSIRVVPKKLVVKP